MDALLNDLTYAARSLRKAPGFTVVAAFTIALAIGACTAVFSVVNGVLLRPLPYSQPDGLVLVWSELRTRHVMDFPLPIPDLRDLRDGTTVFAGLAGMTPPGRIALAGDGGEPEQVRFAGGTSNLFQVLQVPMALGRDFTEHDATPQPAQAPGGQAGAPPGPPPLPVIAIISHQLWQRRYGGDPSVVGRTIAFGNNRAEIVGVLPPRFELLMPPRTGIESDIDLWTALRLNYDTAARSTGALRVLGRLKPGVPLTQAQAEVDAVAATLREQHPSKKNVDLHMRVVGLHADLVRDVRPLVLALFGAVAFVLLIACANVANLLLVRAAARQREFVIRAAIGGSRARLARQLLTEAVVIAAIGGGAGVLLAQWGIDLLVSLAPPALPRASTIGVDASVLGFSVAATMITALLCGLVPAFRESRQDVGEIVRAGHPGLREGRRVRYAVVLVEVALSFALLAGSGLMMRSFLTLQEVDPGYETDHVLTFLRPAARPTPEQRATLIRQTEERLRAVPGVVAVGAANPLPLDGGTANIPWATEEAGSVDPSAFRQANLHFVTPGYFDAMQARLLEGRTFTDADNQPGPPAQKVVIDEMVAAQAFPAGSAVGRRLLVRSLNPGPNGPLNTPVEVIGVVAHQRHESLTSVGREGIFFVDAYVNFAVNRWALRTAGEPMALAPAVIAAMAEMDPRAPLAEVQPMSALVRRANGPTIFATTIIGLFAAVAVVLAAVGLYGVLSTTVRQRTPEIGLRIVCGAEPRRVLAMVLGEGLRLSVAGMTAGLLLATSLTGLIQSLLVEVSPTDPLTFAAISVLFLAIAAVSALVPARRAARVDPVVAIRQPS